MTISPFFHIPVCIERTVNNESLNWGDWLHISAISRKTREVVLSMKPFKVFVMGRLILPKLRVHANLFQKDDRIRKVVAIELLRARTGDFDKVEENLLAIQASAKSFLISQEYWDDKHLQVAKIIAGTSLDNARGKVLTIAEDLVKRESHHSFEFQISMSSIIRALLTQPDDASLELALQLAEKIPSERNPVNSHVFYSGAICAIACAFVKTNSSNGILKAEGLIKDINYTDALIVRCAIAQACNGDLISLIRDASLKTYPNFGSLICWRMECCDSNALEDCLKISEMVKQAADYKWCMTDIYMLSHKQNPNEIDTVKFKIKQAFLERFGNEALYFDFFQNVRWMIRLESVNEDQQLYDSLLNRCQNQVGLELIQHAMNLSKSEQYVFFSKLLENISRATFSRIDDPFSFITKMQEHLKKS